MIPHLYNNGSRVDGEKSDCFGALSLHVQGAMVLPGPSLPEPNQNSPNYPKPKIHTSQRIATANDKISLEVTVLEVTRHPCTMYML